ncbi:MAG TPA: hypothetical protein EYP60_03430, partial [bacterium (Candidatus Stahlbacteria)]|nr:hypothetical protein [Candidatus Stahlbacteria bacterium]
MSTLWHNNFSLPPFVKRYFIVITTYVIAFITFNTPLSRCYATNGIAKVLIFYAEDCENCEYVMNEFIPSIEGKFGTNVEFCYLNVDSIENYKLLVSLEERLGDTGNEFPVAIIGQKVLGGKEEVINELETSIADCIEAGGCNWPQLEKKRVTVRKEEEPSKAQKEHVGKKIYVAYFYTPRCKKCDRAEYMIRALKADYKDLVVKEFDIS